MDKNFMFELGKRLKSLREIKGLKQREIADLLGVQLRCYQRYEYGEGSVPLHTLVFFADFYGVTTDFLLGREN